MRRPALRWQLISGFMLLLAADARAAPPTSNIKAAARCMIRRDPWQSVKAAMTLSESTQEREELTALAGSLAECLPRSGFSDDKNDVFQLLGTIAELTRPRVTWTSGFNQKLLDTIGQSDRLLQETKGLPADVAVVSCATTRDPGTVERLLSTSPGSAKEKAVISEFMPILSRCVAKDKQVRLEARRVRAIAARKRLNETFVEEAIRLH